MVAPYVPLILHWTVSEKYFGIKDAEAQSQRRRHLMITCHNASVAPRMIVNTASMVYVHTNMGAAVTSARARLML